MCSRTRPPSSAHISWPRRCSGRCSGSPTRGDPASTDVAEHPHPGPTRRPLRTEARLLTNPRAWQMFGGEAQVSSRDGISSCGRLPLRQFRQGLRLQGTDHADLVRFAPTRRTRRFRGSSPIAMPPARSTPGVLVRRRTHLYRRSTPAELPGSTEVHRRRGLRRSADRSPSAKASTEARRPAMSGARKARCGTLDGGGGGPGRRERGRCSGIGAAAHGEQWRV